MPVAVTMPDLGESVEEASISRWLYAPGDRVRKDDPLLEVSTDKVDTEISAPASGLLTEILAQDGEVLQVGATLAFIDEGAPSQEKPAPK